LVIDPNFSLPPVEFCLGVAPSQAAKSRPDLNACGFGALARIAEAASAPTPGTLAASRLSGSRRWSATIAPAGGVDGDGGPAYVTRPGIRSSLSLAYRRPDRR
jgi:hypothetical protein